MSFNLNNTYPKPAIYRNSPVADQRLTVAASEVQFSVFNELTTMVLLDIQDADVMCTLDGSTPSATNGHRLYATRMYTWSTAMAAAAKFIQQGAGTAAIHASELQM